MELFNDIKNDKSVNDFKTVVIASFLFSIIVAIFGLLSGESNLPISAVIILALILTLNYYLITILSFIYFKYIDIDIARKDPLRDNVLKPLSLIIGIALFPLYIPWILIGITADIVKDYLN